MRAKLAETTQQRESARVEAEKPFAQEDEMKQKPKRLAELDKELHLDKHDNEVAESDLDKVAPDEEPTGKRETDKER